MRRWSGTKRICPEHGRGRSPRIGLKIPPKPVLTGNTHSFTESMRTKSEIISQLLDPGIIAVVRAKSADQVIPLTEALLAGGVIAVEITMTTPSAIEAIREASQKFGTR